MHFRGIIGAALAAALLAPTASSGQEPAATPAYPPAAVYPPAPAYPPAAVYPPAPVYPPAAYPMTSEGNRAAAHAYKQLYRQHRREYRRQRHLERHGGVVVAVPIVPFPLPVITPVAVAAPVVYAPVPVFVPQPSPVPVAPVAQVHAAKSLARTILGADIQAHPDGAAVGATLFAEGKRVGLHLAASGILARADDGSSRLETLKLVEAHLTWAPISGARGRVRVEAGASAAFAPCLNTVGPDIGLSGDLRVLGSLGLLAAARYAPFPHKRVEATAGLFLGLGPLRLEGGWRSRWLDARVLEGLDTVDSLRGPYLGASLVF